MQAACMEPGFSVSKGQTSKFAKMRSGKPKCRCFSNVRWTFTGSTGFSLSSKGTL